MKNIIRIEELAITAVSIYFISTLSVSFSWWAYILLFFAPDISMLGYAVNNRIGAFSYNLFHHRGIAISIAAVGLYLSLPYLLFAGAILFAHASFDRIFGYGLKYSTGFKHTHLGNIG